MSTRFRVPTNQIPAVAFLLFSLLIPETAFTGGFEDCEKYFPSLKQGKVPSFPLFKQNANDKPEDREALWRKDHFTMRSSLENGQGNKTDKVAQICKEHFAISYNLTQRRPEWVAYKLSPEMVSKRKNLTAPPWSQDPYIREKYGWGAQLINAAFSLTKIFDRGHLVPAADMSWSENSLIDTYQFSNAAFQADHSNKGAWKAWENHIRKWVDQNHQELYVISGVYGKRDSTTHGRFVYAWAPRYLYKVLYDPKEKKSVAVIMPNSALKKDKIIWEDCACAVSSLEYQTDMLFLKGILDYEEKRQVDVEHWELDGYSAVHCHEYYEPSFENPCKIW